MTDSSRTLVRLLPLLGVLLLASALLEPGRLTTGDEAPILGAAHRLLHGQYAVIGTMNGTEFLWHGPGLPALLAPLVALNIPLDGLRLTSPLLMFASALMFYRLLRLRLSPRLALIGAYALGFYAPAYYVLGTVDKDPLALLLSICALDATARYLMLGRRRYAALAGLSLGALAMTRLEYGWVITLTLAVGLAWWLFAHLRHGRAADRTRVARRCAVVCAMGLLVCLPWLTYTYALTDHLFYWGNSGGSSLYWMSSPSAAQLGEWHAAHNVFKDPALSLYRPFFRHLASLGPVGSDAQLRHAALVEAVAHPAKYALNLLANVGRMFAAFPFSFTLPLAMIMGAVLVNGTILIGLVLAGLSLARAKRSLPPETVPYLLFAALGLAVHLLPSAEPRMILPLIPVPIWLIGVAWQRRRRPATAPARRSRAAMVGA